MPEIKMVSPLLDGYIVEKEVSVHTGRSCYTVRQSESGECFILKHLSIPASDSQVRALILSGIYSSDADVQEYYTAVVTNMKKELDIGMQLSSTGCFAGAVDYQIEPKSNGIGYDVYILHSLYIPLNELLERNGMTHLRAINLGIDLCDAIIACRESGYLFQNIKPENIYLMPTGRFLLGDLGLVALQDLDYASVPEEYIGPFSAPELSDIMSSPNLTVDLYSLGMVLYRIYNSNHGPFVDENTNEAMADKLRLTGKPLPTPIYADYELAGIITKACSFRIENRFMSPEQMKQALILYMQRNEISDTLIVPPLVADPEPVVEDEPEAEEAPLRMVEASELDETFKASFTPDLSGSGNEKDSEPVAPAEPEPVKEAAPALPVVEFPIDADGNIQIDLPPAKKSRHRSRSAGKQDKAPDVTPAEVPAEQEAAKEAAPEAQPAASEQPEAATSAQDAPAEAKDAPIEIRVAGGAKMPQGNLKMKRKKRHSSHSRSEEAPLGPVEAAPEVPAVMDTVTIEFSDKAKKSEPQAVETPTADEAAPAAQHFEAPSVSALDEDQIDIDELIASVNEVVGEDSKLTGAPKTDPAKQEAGELTLHVAPIENSYSYFDGKQSDSAEQDTSDSSKEKKPKKWIPITVICFLLLAIIGVVAYLFSNYYVSVTELKVIDYSTEDLIVELITDDPQNAFVLTCTDNYGNAYPRTIDGNRYTFTGLREKTAYTVTVLASEYHRLSSGKSYTMTVTTPGSTQITEFTAERGEQIGQVLLSITHEGPTPTDWAVTYTDENGVLSGPFLFSEHSFVIDGLEEGKSYTFELKPTENLYLSGQLTVEYALLPIVTVESLHITDVSKDTISIAWLCGENVPDEWTVTCTGGDFTKTLTTTEVNAVFTELPDFTRDYTFTVSAPGMDDPAELTLPADPIILEDLKAEYQEDGSVLVTWNTPAGAPAGGWHLSYQTVGSFHVPYVLTADSEDMQKNSATLRKLIPNAEYRITLHLTLEDGSLPLFGETSITLTTPEAVPFNGFDISPKPVYSSDSESVSLWLLPENEDWSYKDLTNMRDTFSKDEKIAICLQVESIIASEETVTLLYVLRDENGQVVVDESKDMTWDALWFDRRHANAVPLPIKVDESASTAGNYTLEIYINGQLLLEKGFSIV